MANQENAGNPPRESKTDPLSSSTRTASVKSGMESNIESAAEESRRFTARAQRQTQNTAQRLKSSSEDIVGQVTTFASERPFAAAAVLLGIGGAVYALSSSLTPRSRSERWSDSVREQLHNIYDSGQRAYGSGTVSSLKRGLAQARRGMRDASSQVGGDLQHFLEAGFEAGNKTVRETVSRHPLATAAVVLGFGAAIASIVASGSGLKRKEQYPRRSSFRRREDLRYEELSSDELAEVAQERGLQVTNMTRSEIIHALRTL